MPNGYTGYALRFVSGKYQGNEIPLPSHHELIFGRGSGIEVVLMEDMISRKHTKIVTGEDDVIVQDLGSTNGTFVNGDRIRKVRLREGDRVMIGTSIIKLIPYEGEGLEADSGLQEPDLGKPAVAPQRSTMKVPSFKAEPEHSAPPAGRAATAKPAARKKKPRLALPPASGIEAPDESFQPIEDPIPTEDQLQAPPSRDRGPAIMSGELEETPLSELMDLFATSRRNGVLVLQHKRSEGRIHMRDGRIVYAIVGNNFTVPTQKAAYRILAWKTGEFQLFPPDDSEIRDPINEAPQRLIQAALRQDEAISKFRKEIPDNTHNISMARPLRAPLRDLRPDYLDTLQLVHNYGMLEQILNKSPSNDVDTYQHLAYLMRHNYIKAH